VPVAAPGRWQRIGELARGEGLPARPDRRLGPGAGGRAKAVTSSKNSPVAKSSRPCRIGGLARCRWPRRGDDQIEGLAGGAGLPARPDQGLGPGAGGLAKFTCGVFQ